MKFWKKRNPIIIREGSFGSVSSETDEKYIEKEDESIFLWLVKVAVGDKMRINWTLNCFECVFVLKVFIDYLDINLLPS